VTISGVTFTMDGDFASAAATSTENYVLSEAVGQDLKLVDAVNESPDAPASLDSPLSPQWRDCGGFFFGNLPSANDTSGDFAAMPEPTVWSALVPGLACIGAILRVMRRQRPATRTHSRPYTAGEMIRDR
jgi:hypothetical protein